MSIFYQEVEEPTKQCKCLTSALKDAFSICHSFQRKLPLTPGADDRSSSSFDEDEEIFVSAIINKYLESKSKRRFSNIGIDSFHWAHSPKVTAGSDDNGVENAEEYFSAGSRVSRCSSFDAFATAKTCFSRCSSLSGIDFQHFDKQRSMILDQLIHCHGWPFGLCRKALLQPPLPKSPPDSWLWTKSGRIIKIKGSFMSSNDL